MTKCCIALVSCVKSKQAAPCRAADLYVSALFQKMRAYAEREADAWYILSAKHGLVHPDDRLEPYEQTLNRLGIDARRAWATKVHRQMKCQGLLATGNTILWLAGARYKDELARLLIGLDQVDPMFRMPIGRRLRWLNDQSQR